MTYIGNEQLITVYLCRQDRAVARFLLVGASWGYINLSKRFSAKILNFKTFQNVLKGFKVNF